MHASIRTFSLRRSAFRSPFPVVTIRLIQIVDTGLDETSCFFADDSGDKVEHGYLFDGIKVDATTGNPSAALGDPSFPHDMSRRKVGCNIRWISIGDTMELVVVRALLDLWKFVYAVINSQVVQYIELFKARCEGDDQDAVGDDTDPFAYFSDYITDFGSTLTDEIEVLSYEYNYWTALSVDPICEDIEPLNITISSVFPSSSTGGFDKDTVSMGHGTLVSGIAAGAISPKSPYLTQDCSSSNDELPGCVGGCISASDVELGLLDGLFDVDLFCPMYDCDDYGAEFSYLYEYCLGDDPLETLAEHSGVAPGAQIAIFDAGYFAGDFFLDLFIFLAGNFLWNSTEGTGTRIHSNSWGAITNCELTEFEYLFETYMLEVNKNGFSSVSNFLMLYSFFNRLSWS